MPIRQGDVITADYLNKLEGKRPGISSGSYLYANIPGSQSLSFEGLSLTFGIVYQNFQTYVRYLNIRDNSLHTRSEYENDTENLIQPQTWYYGRVSILEEYKIPKEEDLPSSDEENTPLEQLLNAQIHRTPFEESPSQADFNSRIVWVYSRFRPHPRGQMLTFAPSRFTGENIVISEQFTESQKYLRIKLFGAPDMGYVQFRLRLQKQGQAIQEATIQLPWNSTVGRIKDAFAEHPQLSPEDVSVYNGFGDLDTGSAPPLVDEEDQPSEWNDNLRLVFPFDEAIIGFNSPVVSETIIYHTIVNNLQNSSSYMLPYPSFRVTNG